MIDKPTQKSSPEESKNNKQHSRLLQRLLVAKDWLKRQSIFDLIAWSAVILIVATRGPGWMKNWQMQGASIPLTAQQFAVLSLDGERKPFPPRADNWVVVFWATWCGPCGIELDRLKDAVEKKSLNPQSILAISVGEDVGLVKKIVAERKYPFQVFVDSNGKVANHFNIQATPTIVLINQQNQVTWITSGLSPSLIWRSERHIGSASTL